MNRINTFAEYQKLVDAGYTPEKAAAQIDVAFSIYHGHEPLTREYMDNKLSHIEKDFVVMRSYLEERLGLIGKDIFYMKVLLGAMFALGAMPLIKKAFGLT